MSKSKRLRLGDVRQAFRLVGECRDLGADVLAWRTRMLQGLRRIVDAQVAVSSEVRIGAGRAPDLIGAVDLGWPSPAARCHFMRYIEEGAMANDATLWNCAGLARPVASRRRVQLIDDRTWYISSEFREYHLPAESDDWLGSIASVDGPKARASAHFYDD
jgi:hypothetical protein